MLVSTHTPLTHACTPYIQNKGRSLLPVAGRGAVSLALPGLVRGVGAVGVFLSRGKRHDRSFFELEKRVDRGKGIEKANNCVDISRVILGQK